jgi:hypothetical protein
LYHLYLASYCISEQARPKNNRVSSRLLGMVFAKWKSGSAVWHGICPPRSFFGFF